MRSNIHQPTFVRKSRGSMSAEKQPILTSTTVTDLVPKLGAKPEF